MKLVDHLQMMKDRIHQRVKFLWGI